MPPVIDIHTHLAGVGHGGTGCFIAPRKFNSLFFSALRRMLGIYGPPHDSRVDQAYLERLDKDIAAAAQHGVLDAIVVFAHDRVYDDSGEPARNQELYVPNEYVFACAERPGSRMLPAVSVHPYRKDALDDIAKWIERGTVALKWLPNSQRMDPRDPRCLPIYDLLAAKKVPLIAHTGGEHTVAVLRPELGDPAILRPALDRGVAVIVAHSATKSGFFDAQWLPAFRELALQYPNCWGDTSAFCTPGRMRWIKRVLRDPQLTAKLVHGSDYPVPPSAWPAIRTLGWRRMRELSRVTSWLERDILIKRALGMPDAVFTRAAGILPPGSLQRWRIGVPTTKEDAF
jgi:predicted TIM-barrel fold metal-dependent hydrolase